MDRLGGEAGILFVGFFFVSKIFVPEGPSFENAAPDEIRAYYADHQDALRLSVLFGSLALTFFLWFGAVLRSQLAQAEGPQPTYATLANGAAILYAGFLILGLWLSNAAWGLGDTSDTAVQSLHALQNVDNLALEASRFFLVLFLGAVGFVLVQTGVYPKWLGWAGIALAAVFLVAAFDDVVPGSSLNDLSFAISILGFLGWTVTMGTLVAFRGPRYAAAASMAGPA